MGCDVHMLAEVNRDGQWQVDGAKRFKSWSGPTDAPYSDRYYDLFALLAGVRNYGGVKPICEPRGVPEDASLLWQGEVEYWGADLHSMSWLTLAELEEADWDQEGRDGPLREAGGRFLNETMPKLCEIAKEHGVSADEVRIVFGFDN